jgi:hypothetical protein
MKIVILVTISTRHTIPPNVLISVLYIPTFQMEKLPCNKYTATPSTYIRIAFCGILCKSAFMNVGISLNAYAALAPMMLNLLEVSKN